MDLASKKTLVTGGNGFLGSYIVEEFLKSGVPSTQLFIAKSKEHDLRDLEGFQKIFEQFRPHVVVHAAAKVGGIGYNVKYPTEIFRDNLMMALNILELASRNKVEKMTIVGSACMYPGALTGHFKEEDLLNGPLHPTVEVYGFSKRALLSGARAYQSGRGLNFSFAVPTNLYGPRDTFDPDRSHVVAALVRKFVDAREDKKDEVICWGTGAAVREFMWAGDAAQAIVRLTALENYSDPINLGTGIGTSIKELATLTARLTGYQGKVTWDTSKPDGALQKVLDVSRMKSVLGFEPSVTLEDGLKKTIDWYAANRKTLGYV